MKERLLKFLVCPLDGTRLELVKWEVEEVPLSNEALTRLDRMGADPEKFATEILTGALINPSRRIFYPIHNGIPRMLVFPTGVARDFAAKHAERLAAELNGYALPSEAAVVGEEAVLKTFSSEWVNYDWDEKTYWITDAELMYRTMNALLGLARRPIKDQAVLEVGIGIGGIADYMARVEECELVGVDLSYSVDPAYRHFGRNPFLHIVQASLFRLPHAEETFDLVYSHGVLHHTFSTKAAFDRIARLPKVGGRLYVWVYSDRDEERSLERRLLMRVEGLIRPLMWRLPTRLQTVVLLATVPLYLVRQNLLADRRKPGFIRYGVREAMHAARDRLTPRYAHRHSDEEVSAWFRGAGYAELERVSEQQHESFVPSPYVLATGVQGLRARPGPEEPARAGDRTDGSFSAEGKG